MLEGGCRMTLGQEGDMLMGGNALFFCVSLYHPAFPLRPASCIGVHYVNVLVSIRMNVSLLDPDTYKVSYTPKESTYSINDLAKVTSCSTATGNILPQPPLKIPYSSREIVPQDYHHAIIPSPTFPKSSSTSVSPTLSIYHSPRS